MSTAHRPTWAPAQAKDVGSGSRQLSVRDLNENTKLKFRQPGQGGPSSSAASANRRDLKAELAKAERAAKNKRKGITTIDEDENDKAAGVPSAGLVEGLPAGGANQSNEDEEQANKRRKLIQQAVELDRDDSSDEEDDDEDDEDGTSKAANGATPSTNGNAKGKGKAVESAVPANDDDDEEDGETDEEDSEAEEDDEDETAELLRELEKIKRERAEEKARQDRDRAESAAISQEEAAALGNPLLNLQAALSGNKNMDSPGGYSSASGRSGASSFAIQKRWDDDVIFKNQAMKQDDGKKDFVNDLIRTQFHRRFLQKYIA